MSQHRPPPRVLVVSGSRADYGLLRPVMEALDADPAFELLVLVTGMHLEERFGSTWRAFDDDGFSISARVPTDLADDEEETIAAAMGRGIAGCARTYQELAPDLVLLLGDRFEILAAASAALVCRVPVAHLCGGDVTEGAWDEGIRHAITKMSHLHFPTHDAAAARIVAMGESPARVFAVGSTGIDALVALDRMSRAELERDLGFALRRRNLLITYHPETLATGGATEDIDQLLAALDAINARDDDIGMLFTFPNADAGGTEIRERIEEFVARNANAGSWTSLGQTRYLSLMGEADVVVGNSSSGLYEAPSLRTATVNIGGRQDGRPRAASVISVVAVKHAIVQALDDALALDCSATVSPYGDGHATGRVVAALAAIHDFPGLLRKGFHELAEQR